MKKILLSIILLALCLIQASADNYYYRIWLYNDNGQLEEWPNYIEVWSTYIGEVDGVKKYEYHNGLGDLIAGLSVKDVKGGYHTLPKKNDKVDLDRIYGIAFANGKGMGKDGQNIMEGDEYYKAWKDIHTHIKYLGLRDYKLDTYTGGDGYFIGMDNLEELELPKDGMKVGNGDKDCHMYFSNAGNLRKITIWSGDKNASVDITDKTDKAATGTILLDRVGKFMFSNCYSLSTKYINRLIKDVTEIKDNAFKADDGNRNKFSDEADNKMAIEIPNSVTKIGDLAFWNRVKVTGLNIQGDGGSLDIGFEAFRGCDELAKITDNKELKIHKNAFRGCKQLNAFENMDKAKITYLLKLADL